MRRAIKVHNMGSSDMFFYCLTPDLAISVGHPKHIFAEPESSDVPYQLRFRRGEKCYKRFWSSKMRLLIYD